MGINTAIGIGVGIPFNKQRTSGDRPYIPPELRDKLCGVWIADQNTNDSPTRNIIKNKFSDRGGDFEILNAAYKLNSGYGKYNVDFTTWSKAPNNKLEYTDYYIKVKSVDDFNPYGYVIWRTTAINSFKVRIKGLQKDTILRYTYFDDAGQHIVRITEDGIYELSGSIDNTSVGFGFSIIDQPRESFIGLTITQIPEYQGAFVTDGVDDIIMSQKFISDMTNGSNELTVISMMHQLSFSNGANNMAHTNIVRENNTLFIRNDVLQINETGIYGYASTGTAKRSIKNILGDKNNYLGGAIPETDPSIIASNFSVCTVLPNIYPSSVAWYWTFIAKRELTDDEINQVIAYYNLDKYITPDVYYNVKRQGLTNDNHAQFGDKLIDYSGNSRDMQLYNIGWEGMSGINSYPVILGKNKTWKEASTKQGVFTHNSIHITEQNSSQAVLFTYIINGGVYIEENNKEIPAFNVRVTGITDKYTLYYRYIKEDGEVNTGYSIKTDGVYTFPKSHLLGNTTSTSVWIGFHVAKNNPDITNPSDIFIEILPEYEGALVTDGIEDYGKVEGLPIYKDYTVIAERAWIYCSFNNGSLVSKSLSVNNGAFIIEQSFNSDSGYLATYSFGVVGGAPTNNVNEKSIVVQSKYKYISDKSYDLVAGSGIDVDSMTLATVREEDTRFSKLALWMLMSFPYSLSEFLIKRQLQKNKIIKDMVIFLPILNTNNYVSVEYYTTDLSKEIKPNDWFPKGYDFAIKLKVNNHTEVDKVIFQNKECEITKVADEENTYIIICTNVVRYAQMIYVHFHKFINFEEVGQPYPVFLNFIDENGNKVSWGDRIKVGSTITIVGDLNDNNIFPELYDVKDLTLNGELVTNEVVVQETMKFNIVSDYIINDNAPVVIYSPKRLRLDNDTYKRLGYIPDITGNGNHGILNNFAYAGMSGADGYPTNFNEWKKYGFVASTYNTFTLKTEPTDYWLVFNTSGTVMPKFSVNITGIPDGGRLVYTCNAVTTFMVNGVNTIPATTLTHTSGFYINRMGDGKWKDLVIELLPDYEGSVTFDGVEDFVNIPTLNVGGNQVLMKVRWSYELSIMYDQRINNSVATFAVFCGNSSNGILAYNGRNVSGTTYINGLLNDSKLPKDLINQIHSLTMVNRHIDINNDSKSPIIGCSEDMAYYSDLSLYDFMLFKGIDSADVIKELDTIINTEE